MFLGECNSQKPVSIDNKEDQVTAFTFATEIPKGEAVLSIDFDGEINDKMNGFYRSSYKDKDGSTKYMAVTQFEATSARYNPTELVQRRRIPASVETKPLSLALSMLDALSLAGMNPRPKPPLLLLWLFPRS